MINSFFSNNCYPYNYKPLIDSISYFGEKKMKRRYINKMILKNLRIKKLIIIISIFIFLSLGCNIVNADTFWKPQLVESNAVGDYASFALDSDDNPHFLYGRMLEYAYWTGDNWNVQNIKSSLRFETSINFKSYHGGNYYELKLDSSNNPHICYIGSDKDVKYAYWTGASWNIEILESDQPASYYISLDLDKNDIPHICYSDVDDNNAILKYAVKKGNSWDIQTAVSDGYSRGCSIVVDDENNPHICYIAGNGYPIRYAYYNGASWEIKEFDDDGNYYRDYFSIALDKNNNPHISYFSSKYGLRYAYSTGSSWSIQNVEEGDTGYYTSIALDSNDNPHISYFSDIDGSIKKYTYLSGSKWNTETIASDENTAERSKIIFDSNNQPHISYGLLYYTQEEESLPSTPTEVVANSYNGYVRLSWSEPENIGSQEIDSYTIYRGTKPGQVEKYVTGIEDTNYKDNDVTNEQTYYYRLTAVNNKGEGTSSEEVSAKPSDFAKKDPLISQGVFSDNINDVLNLTYNQDTLRYDSEIASGDISNLDITEISYLIDDEHVILHLKIAGEIDDTTHISYSMQLNTTDATYLLEYDNGVGACSGRSLDWSQSIPLGDVETSYNTITATMDLIGESTMVDFHAESFDNTGYMTGLSYLYDSAENTVPNSYEKNTGTPGFEFIVVLLAMIFIIYQLRKRNE